MTAAPEIPEDAVEAAMSALATEFTAGRHQRNRAWDPDKPDGPGNEFYLPEPPIDSRFDQGMYRHFIASDGYGSMIAVTPREAVRAALAAAAPEIARAAKVEAASRAEKAEATALSLSHDLYSAVEDVIRLAAFCGDAQMARVAHDWLVENDWTNLDGEVVR